tara:strand:- start:219 stop:590 length:372 start_codon:yes stop_codon:yes gene_type:complete
MDAENSEKESKDKYFFDFLNKCNINCNNLDNLDGILIERDILLGNKYELIKNDIPNLKEIIKSTFNTSVQKNAEQNQRWPLINLLRQLLKNYGYQLEPKRIANGYTKDGIKIYKRLFEIKKIK